MICNIENEWYTNRKLNVCFMVRREVRMKQVKRNATRLLLLSMVTVALGSYTGYAHDAQAVEETVILPDVTVTATRTLQDISKTPSSISVVTAKDIENRKVDTVADAIQLLPGVYKSQASAGEIQIRGFDSKNISVLVDGVPMNNSFNNKVDWEVIPVHSIDRIELVRGASSSLYGGKGVAGVLSITTKQVAPKANRQGIRWHGKVNGGTYGTWNNELGFDARVSDKVAIGVSAEERRTNGFPGFFVTEKSKAIKGDVKAVSPETPLKQLTSGKYVVGNRGDKSLHNKNLSTYITMNLGDKETLTYRYVYANHKYSYHNPISAVTVNGKTVFTGDIKVSDKKYVSLNGNSFLGHDAEREYHSHSLQYKNEANKLQISLGYLDKKKDGYSVPTKATSGDYEGPGSHSFYPGKAYNLDVQKAWKTQGKHQIVGGLNWKQERFDQEKISLQHWRDKNSKDTKVFPNGVSETNTGASRTMAVFVQDTYRPNDDWAIYAGLRLDHFKKYDGSHGEYNKKTKSYDVVHHNDGSYTELSPKLSLERYLDDSTNVYASYGHSFAPPTLYQVYRFGQTSKTPIYANPELDPEHSDTFELGLKKSWNESTKLNVAAFYVNTKDKIQYVTFKKTDGTEDYKKYINIGSETRRGVELELRHKLSNKWSVFGNYTWQIGYIESKALANTDQSDGKEQNFEIPRHLFHGGLEYNSGKWNVLWDMQYVSSRNSKDTAGGEPESEDAYFLTNASVNYKVSKEATLQFGVQNLFDREYYAREATGGRTYNVGMKFKF